MARTMFDMGFRPGSLFDAPSMGLSLKDLTSKAAQLFSPSTKPATPVAPKPPAPPQDTILGLPPTVAALGGLGLLGTIAAIAFGHK